MSTKKITESDTKKTKTPRQLKGATKNKVTGANKNEFQKTTISEEEQAAIDAIMGKKPSEESGNKTVQELKHDNGNEERAPIDSIASPFCYIENYVIRTITKDTKGKTPLSELKENIDKMDSKDLSRLFEELVLFFKNSRNDEKKKPETICLEDLLTNSSSVFERQYFDNIETLYPSMIKLNQYIDFSLTPCFAREAEPALYGVKFNNGGTTTTRFPLKKDRIEKIIDAEIKTEHPYTAGKWIYAVLSFSEKKLVEYLCNPGFDVVQNCGDTKAFISSKLSSSADYKNALSTYLFSNDSISLTEIIKNNVLLLETDKEKDAQIELLKSECARLTEKTKETADKLRQCEDENRIIPELKSEITSLREKNTSITRRLDTQISMNEDVVQGKQKAIHEANLQIDKLLSECNTLSEKNDENNHLITDLTREKENLESDLQNERMRGASIRSDSEKAISKAREELTGDFISAIKDQLNHFSKAFSYFKEDGYDEDTLDVCIDDYNSIIESLIPFGIEPIGVPGQKTAYNIDEHYSEEAIASDALIQVVSLGWKVFGKVISKAEVERVEE